MKKINTVTLCASASFYKRLWEVKGELNHRGFKVKIPNTALIMRKNNDFNVRKHKTWLTNALDYQLKRKLMNEHFKKVISSDCILVINLKKHNLKGYIGGNVLMEMTLAHHFKKKIFILNRIDENLPIKEEVLGLFPVFLDGDIAKIS